MPEALSALRTDDRVQVSTVRWLVFEPTDQVPVTGLVLYPGGRVDPRSYAPSAREFAAQQGALVIIAPMPLNLAIFAPERATEIIRAFPAIEHWAIGGHSLGGAMAARYAYRNPEQVDGLVLWAAYPAAGDDLSGQQIEVVSVYATRDGLTTADEITASRALLPANTRWVAIEGGNHAQFGWYGPQDGDNEASISRAAQQLEVVAGTAELLSRIER
jgi:pimeloyl-ACP methyl ester carboxylesterase